ncbi:MAG: cysteine--tRNA ligase [Peptococcaceae bacterium]|nr:cysteine--tRNA ligase [Peptococcaceae bacterium]
MSLKLYNTMTRKKEDFIPREQGKVAIYACGPTTYNFFHLGNARMFVVFDTVRRYLQYKGYKVTYVQNFTDIDDKIINRAKEEGMDALALAEKYIQEYFKDADALNIQRADIHPKATEHISLMIEMIETLVAKGLAYAVDGDVYFEVRKFAEYGKLSGRDPDDLRSGARVEVDTRKKDPLDFALWKGAKEGEPSWESPWGKGRPGWHIECSAMALKYLGPGFDIHGGGGDLTFPHHENEIAQAEGYLSAQPFAHYWMHNGFITVNQEKMSKSLGNFFTVRDILAKFPASVVRFYLIGTQYRSPLDFDDQKLAMSKKALDRLINTCALSKEALARSVEDASCAKAESIIAQAQQAEKAFIEAMDDDFNTALALAALFDLSKDTNNFLADYVPCTEGQRALEFVLGTFDKLSGILGIDLENMENVQDDHLVDGLMQLIISIRAQARQNKDWPTADKIRDGIKELGIVLEDTPQGVRWKRQ